MDNPISKFKKNIYSQYGEDGIIDELLARLQKHVALDHWCVEFGAWDGLYLSNTCNLIKNKKYNAVLIEGNPVKANELHLNFPENNIHKICKFVDFFGENSLDNILSQTPIPCDFDFLSIDIDGVDYHVFDSLKIYTPKVICIEFNPTIPNAVEFIQKKDFSVKQGSSAKSLQKLAHSKGYKLVACTKCNLILVRESLFSFLDLPETNLETLYPDGNDAHYIFVGYDGTILSNKDKLTLLYHNNIDVPMNKIQFLPYYLRSFKESYSFLKKTVFILFVFVHSPKQFWQLIKSRVLSS